MSKHAHTVEYTKGKCIRGSKETGKEEGRETKQRGQLDYMNNIMVFFLHILQALGLLLVTIYYIRKCINSAINNLFTYILTSLIAY